MHATAELYSLRYDCCSVSLFSTEIFKGREKANDEGENRDFVVCDGFFLRMSNHGNHLRRFFPSNFLNWKSFEGSKVKSSESFAKLFSFEGQIVRRNHSKES